MSRRPFAWIVLSLGAFLACAPAAEDADASQGAASTDDEPPAELRREIRVLQRDDVTNAWLATEPSRLDGRPIGITKERVSELYVRLLEALEPSEVRPAVLGLAATFAADDAALPMRSEFVKRFVEFPAPLAAQVVAGSDQRFLAPRVAFGHDRVQRSCDVTPDGSCADGRYFIPLDDPENTYVAKQPFAVALVAATDAAARHETSGVAGIASALTKVQRHARPFDTRHGDGDQNVPKRTRFGVPFQELTVTRYGISEVLTSARVRDDLRGRIVVIVGVPGSRKLSFYGGAMPAEETTLPPLAQLAPLVAEP